MLKKTTYIRVINGENHLDKEHYTYVHIREDEHLPFYIGVGTQNKKSGRFSRSKVTSDKSSLWKNKLKDKRYYIVICTSSDNYDEVKEHEIDGISELGKIKEGGLLVNITDGGEGCKGYKHTKEHILYLKERYRGVNNPMYGKKISEETRHKMSISQKGRKHTEETKKIISEKKIARGYQGKYGAEHGRARAVNQIDPITNEIINTFPTLREAAKFIEGSDKSIGRSCKMGGKTKNYNWRYV